MNYLKNVPLTYSNGLKRFTAEDITNVSLAKFGITFAYFPYADQGKQPEGYVKADGQPLEMPELIIHIAIVTLLGCQQVQNTRIVLCPREYMDIMFSSPTTTRVWILSRHLQGLSVRRMQN